jgi:hypothetical protein
MVPVPDNPVLQTNDPIPNKVKPNKIVIRMASAVGNLVELLFVEPLELIDNLALGI